MTWYEQSSARKAWTQGRERISAQPARRPLEQRGLPLPRAVDRLGAQPRERGRRQRERPRVDRDRSSRAERRDQHSRERRSGDQADADAQAAHRVGLLQALR
jgi:hypothetical protein